MIKDLTQTTITSKDNEINYLRSMLTTNTILSNAAHAAAAASVINNADTSNAAHTLLNLTN